MTASHRRVRERLHGMRELHEIIGAIRALSAIRLKQAEDQVAGVTRYGAVVEDACQRVLALVDDRPDPWHAVTRPATLIVMGSEHGFVGGLNRRLLERTSASDVATPAIVVGARLARAFEEDGRPAPTRLPMAAHAGGVEGLARRLAATIRGSRRPLSDIELIHPRAIGQGRVEPVHVRLWPMPARKPVSAAAPLHNLPADVLLEDLIEEYALSRFARAIVETMVGVNQARLLGMQGAYDNIANRVHALEHLAHRLRQEEITTEVIEIAAGAQAAAGV